MADSYGIIGTLYYIFKQYKLTGNQRDFIQKTLAPNIAKRDLNPNNIGPIMTGDYFIRFLYNTISNNLKKEDAFLHSIEETLSQTADDIQKSIMQKLPDIVLSVERYSLHRDVSASSDYREYDPILRELLLHTLKSRQNAADLAYDIYTLIHFAVLKKLPEDFSHGRNRKHDREEYWQTVIFKYGAHSLPGVRKTIELAQRDTPNIYALYEYADMFFYGNIYGQEKDIAKAYILYKKAAGLSNVTNTIAKPCHPLALWSLAFIYFNYKKPNSRLANCQLIPEIDDWSIEDRYELAIRHCMSAISLGSSGAAANLLGNIVYEINNKSSDILKYLLKKYSLETAEYYFTYACEKEYIYGHINLAKLEAIKANLDQSNVTTHLKRCLQHLDIAAQAHEPYAANILGRLYVTGTLPSIEGAPTFPLPELQNPDKALTYFHYAIDHYCLSYHSAYAFANIIKYYPNLFKDNQSLLDEYLSNIKYLNNDDALKIAQNALETYDT